MYGEGDFLFLWIFLFSTWGILRKRRILPDSLKCLIERRWHPYKVRLRASHIRLIRGKAIAPVDGKTSVCRNCGTTYVGYYCNRCGQSRETTRFQLGNVMKNIAGGFFNIDRGFGRTLIDLLCRPGYLISDYLSGKCVRYFRPFQTLFVLAAFYTMAVQLVDPEALFKKNKPERIDKKEVVDTVDRLPEKDQLSLEKMEENELTNIVISFLNKKEALLDKAFREFPFLRKLWDLLKSWGHGNKALRIILVLPLLAIAERWVLGFGKIRLEYNTVEHVFVQAYIACQILLLSILVLPFNGRAQVDDYYELPWWLIFVLFCWDYKQLCRSSWWVSFWRVVLLFVICLLILLLLAVLVLAFGIYLLALDVG